MPLDLALLSTPTGSNYPCLELILMVPKVFEPLKFDCRKVGYLSGIHDTRTSYFMDKKCIYFLLYLVGE